MALVAYDDSDTSEYEDEESNKITPVASLNSIAEKKTSLKLPEPVQIQVGIKREEDSQEYNGPNLFNLLPQPSNKTPSVIEEDDEFLHKKEIPTSVKHKAKITVPSLSEFKDVETSIPAAKRRSSNGKKSGLLSMLPQPRNGVTTTTKSLIPNVLTRKPTSAPVVKKNPTTITKPIVNPTLLINDYSDDSDTEEVQNDFFSINKPIVISTDVDMPLDVEQSTSMTKTNVPKRIGIESYFKQEEPKHVELKPESNSIEEEPEPGPSHNEYGVENSNSNDVVLDDEAIMKLCGSRGKRKREEIQIVDVNQQEVLADAREMLLKGLMDDTTKRVSASKKKGHEPTSQQRRKHQITYLAYQAKANEAELQNQWANNRMSKRQTQAKYGF